MVNKQVFLNKIWLQQSRFLLTRYINPKFLEINTQTPFLESCNVNDSTKDGRSTTARSSPCPSVLGRVFKSGAITIELYEINSWNFIHKCVVSSQYVRTRMTIPVLLFMSYLLLVKINSKGHNSLTLWRHHSYM